MYTGIDILSNSLGLQVHLASFREPDEPRRGLHREDAEDNRYYCYYSCSPITPEFWEELSFYCYFLTGDTGMDPYSDGLYILPNDTLSVGSCSIPSVITY